jgi:hypothetical protein
MPALKALALAMFGPWVLVVGKATLRADLLAGLLGALLVLPQAFAFATLAGLPPQYGLYTAIVPCIVAALFGSSLHVMSGPTNANSLALAAALAPLAMVGSAGYIELALAVTVIVGVMQLLIGGLRLGAVANFISPAHLAWLHGRCGALDRFPRSDRPARHDSTTQPRTAGTAGKRGCAAAGRGAGRTGYGPADGGHGPGSEALVAHAGRTCSRRWWVAPCWLGC